MILVQGKDYAMEKNAEIATVVIWALAGLSFVYFYVRANRTK